MFARDRDEDVRVIEDLRMKENGVTVVPCLFEESAVGLARSKL